VPRGYDLEVSTVSAPRIDAGSGVRRLGWGLADQALSSLTNFALAVLVARQVSTAGLGAFGLAFTTYTITLGATRALCAEPLTVRFSAISEAEWRKGAAAATGMALVAGVLAGILCIAASLFFHGTLGPSLLVLGLSMPGLIVQDSWRSAFFANLRGSYAFANDLVWAIAQVALVAAVLVVGARSAPAFILAWAGAANVGAVFGIVQSGFVPRPDRARWWLYQQRDLGPRYMIEFIARNAAQSGAMYATAGFAGLSAAGALRGAQVALGPLNILNMGITSPAIAESVRISRRSPRRMLRAVTILGVVLVVAFSLWGVAMYLLPDSIGEALLKRSWHPAHDVILPYTAVMAASGMLTAATVGLRAMAAAKRSMRSRLITGVLSVSLGTAGAATYGAVGAAIGLAAGLWIGGIQWWKQLADAVTEEEDRRLVAAAAPLDPAPGLDPAGGRV
jgi:O-antigen/teichoic acid export membrane protein